MYYSVTSFTTIREEALKHWCMTHQIKACELNLVGYEDEDD